MGRSQPLTKQKVQELAGKLGLYVVDQPPSDPSGSSASAAPAKATGSDLLAFLADRGLDSVDAVEAAISGGAAVEPAAEPAAGPGAGDPPPSLTLTAARDADFMAALALYRVHYMSHEEWRHWEMWRERHQ